MEEQKDWKAEIIIEKLKLLSIDCPQCQDVKNDEYDCTICHNIGGNGLIKVFDYLKENKEILDK